MFVVLLLAMAAMARAGCDNQCSGHGTCGTNAVCTCYDNWGLGLSHDSGDCSERICPFEFSWVDTPDESGSHHKYSECASKGICDRESGTCECFAGYEGKACQRTSCPNDCSGHGRCEYIENMVFKNSIWDYEEADAANNRISYTSSNRDSAKSFDYRYWDKTKTRGCVCDPEYADVDCSKRMCPYGNDVMDHRPDTTDAFVYHTQRITFTATDTKELKDVATKDRTFALKFTSKLNETFTTIPIVFKGYTNTGETGEAQTVLTHDQWNTFSDDVEAALMALPNEVIDNIDVRYWMPDAAATPEVGYMNITFTGSHVQGTQNLLEVVHTNCGDGCTPKLDGFQLGISAHMTETETDESADWNSYECGRRGKCDYDSGVCECFEGYTGIACNTITALV